MINMTLPAAESPLDKTGGLLGQPLDRIDGPLKVTGRAPYAYEYREGGAPAYAFLVEAGIATGRLMAIDTGAAKKAPGVILVLTYKNAPKQDPKTDSSAPQLIDDKILHHGQPIALVVAETFEQARAAAYLMKPTYASEKASMTWPRPCQRLSFPKSATATIPTAAWATRMRPSLRRQ